ncbi:MAG: hypothetical protein KA313_02990 [Pseudarcicella sp.]|nr:hypothetical protein [Pseudarcicella sp.]MBP6410043.1 hypothetical protein [Pseudarcicella sp.]
MSDFKQVEIFFETASIIPAPFSNRIDLKIIHKGDTLSVDFTIHFTDREDLSEEEIYEEGFTPNDDYSWKGDLSIAWAASINNLISNTGQSLKKKVEEEQDNYLLLKINGKEAPHPTNENDWEYLLQELTQAVYETSQKERNLTIKYIKIDPNQLSKSLSIDLFFSTRKVLAISQIGEVELSKNLAWEEAKDLVQQVYVGEFFPEIAQAKTPNKPGKYLYIGDEYWYEFNKSIKNPSGNKKYIANLLTMFDELIG